MSRFLILTAVFLAVADPVAAQTQTTAKVTVRLPRDARLFVDDVFCPLPGETRSFDTPPLEAMKQYYYTLRVEITVEGKPIRVSKRAIVEVGKESVTDFGDRDAIIAASIIPDPKEVAPPKKEIPGEEKKDDSPAKAPAGPNPEYALAYIKGDVVFILKPITVTEYVDEERTVTVEGKPPQKATIKVPKITLKQVELKAKLENVRTFDLKGREIAKDKVPVVLEKETAVLLVHEAKLDPFFLRTIKEGTVLLEIRPELVTQAPPMPVPPIKPPTVTPTRPVESMAPAIVNAEFKEGFIVWKTPVVELQEVKVKVKEKGPDGKEVEKEVIKVVPVQKEVETKVEAAKSILKTVGGKSVVVDDLTKRLATPTPIVVSMDGNPIDPFHLQLYDDDTLTIIPPREVPMGPPPGASE